MLLPCIESLRFGRPNITNTMHSVSVFENTYYMAIYRVNDHQYSVLIKHFAVSRLEHLTVHSPLRSKLPKSLTIPSCNLKLGATLGQG